MDDLSALTSGVETITPDTARKMLRQVVGSGRIDQAALDAFARDMQHDRWSLNGAPIVFSTDGRVLDGRARLYACVLSQKSFETLVVRGIKADTFETIDAVSKRTLADVLSIRKETHGRALASALRIIWTYQSGGTPGSGKAPTPTSLLEVLEHNPDIRDSILPGIRAMPLLPHGCAIALHYLASKVSSEKADQFMAQIGQPTSSDADNPIIMLRAALSSLRGQGGARRQTYLLAISFKSWNAFCRGKPIKQLRFGENEAFPRIDSEPDWGPLSRSLNPSCKANILQPSRPLTVRAVLITPDMADKMLADRGPNRHVSAAVISKYARDMSAGRWRLNGQTIKVASDGRLLDGQHRLEAAKKAKKPFPAIIVEGLAAETFSSVDIGRRRAMSDVLRERGETNTMILASALRWLWMIKHNVVLAANSSPTNGELLEILEEYPTVRNSLKNVSGIRDIMGTGIAGALHCTCAERDTSKADEFFARLIDGVQLSEESPIRHLRERLIRTRSSHRVRLAEAERLALSIKAWNAFRGERPVQLLTWRNRGSTRESLPLVQ